MRLQTKFKVIAYTCSVLLLTTVSKNLEMTGQKKENIIIKLHKGKNRTSVKINTDGSHQIALQR